MRHYKVNGIDHTVYEEFEEVPDKVLSKLISDRDNINVGSWLKADDGCYMEVLRYGEMKKPKGKNRIVKYIGTCTGTYLTKGKIDSSRRENIYTVSGMDTKTSYRRELNKYERMFIHYVTTGISPKEAYLKSFPTNDPHYAGFKSAELTKTTRIRKAMKKELEPILEKLGVTEEYVLSGIKDTAEVAEKEDVRLRALFKLSDILDMEDKSATKVQQITGVQFKGFSDHQLNEAVRPKEVTAGPNDPGDENG